MYCCTIWHECGLRSGRLHGARRAEIAASGVQFLIFVWATAPTAFLNVRSGVHAHDLVSPRRVNYTKTNWQLEWPTGRGLDFPIPTFNQSEARLLAKSLGMWACFLIRIRIVLYLCLKFVNLSENDLSHLVNPVAHDWNVVYTANLWRNNEVSSKDTDECNGSGRGSPFTQTLNCNRYICYILEVWPHSTPRARSDGMVSVIGFG